MRLETYCPAFRTDSHAQTASYLLYLGAVPLVKDQEGRNVLHTLSWHTGSTSTIAVMLEKGSILIPRYHLKTQEQIATLNQASNLCTTPAELICQTSHSS